MLFNFFGKIMLLFVIFLIIRSSLVYVNAIAPTNLHLRRKLTESADHICSSLKITHKVIIGQSWGTLPLSSRKKWTELNCDEVLKDKKKSVSGGMLVAPGTLKNLQVSRSSDSEKAWCESAMASYGVIPMKTWGRLPQDLMLQWKEFECNNRVMATQILSKPISDCSSENPINGTGLTVIAIMAASSTRNDYPASSTLSKPDVALKMIEHMSLFNVLLPSLARTLDCGFQYVFVLGYDIGDLFYDDELTLRMIYAWFEKQIKGPLRKKNIHIELSPVGFVNVLKKPGPVFNEMARVTKKRHNPDYYYRINDDTEMVAPWAKKFTSALRFLSSPYGVVGPWCDQGNKLILTHDFVHKTHMAIFDDEYYPSALVDWWMDDWISFVYGFSRSFKARSVPVIHHTGLHGQRYQVNMENQQLLQGLLKQGREKIRKYIQDHNSGDALQKILVEYDRDSFFGFTHRNIPV